jgi:Tfp pilus assembly protein PilP
MTNVTFAQKSLARLDTVQYPALSYKSEKINASRDLFRVLVSEQTISKSFQSEPQTIAVPAQVMPLCHKWSKTLVYLGVFSTAVEEAAMIQGPQLKTTKVKVGEFLAEEKLTLKNITQGKLSATNTDSSICWLNKLTY